MPSWVRTARSPAGAILCVMLVAMLVFATMPRARAPRSATHPSLQMHVSGKHTERGGLTLARPAGRSGWPPPLPEPLPSAAGDERGLAPALLASLSPRAPPLSPCASV